MEHIPSYYRTYYISPGGTERNSLRRSGLDTALRTALELRGFILRENLGFVILCSVLQRDGINSGLQPGKNTPCGCMIIGEKRYPVSCVTWVKSVGFQHPCRIMFLFFHLVSICVIGEYCHFLDSCTFFSLSFSYPAKQASFLPHVTHSHVKALWKQFTFHIYLLP
jgi:hypothetical protein